MDVLMCFCASIYSFIYLFLFIYLFYFIISFIYLFVHQDTMLTQSFSCNKTIRYDINCSFTLGLTLLYLDYQLIIFYRAEIDIDKSSLSSLWSKALYIYLDKQHGFDYFFAPSETMKWYEMR